MYTVVDEDEFRRRCTDTFWAYTDGSTVWTGAGGWGALIGSGGVATERFGATTRGGTSMFMELIAIVRALEFIGLRDRRRVTIYTDCKDIVDDIRKIPAKQAVGFAHPNGRPIPGAALWRQIGRGLIAHDLKFQWVRSHNGDRRNSRADELAKQGLSLIVPRDSKGRFIVS